ncbi:uncharacterized protein LOC125093918 [Lutra lutra]|uniref:uncharacterized protein LOC125093918 n=1 Tax=Lutra lutra TaxID=9657 RepID=UPI001FD53728|nr:uncharacterized protein LOC125093918 [Lutra lutra]
MPVSCSAPGADLASWRSPRWSSSASPRSASLRPRTPGSDALRPRLPPAAPRSPVSPRARAAGPPCALASRPPARPPGSSAAAAGTGPGRCPRSSVRRLRPQTAPGGCSTDACPTWTQRPATLTWLRTQILGALRARPCLRGPHPARGGRSQDETRCWSARSLLSPAEPEPPREDRQMDLGSSALGTSLDGRGQPQTHLPLCASTSLAQSCVLDITAGLGSRVIWRNMSLDRGACGSTPNSLSEGKEERDPGQPSQWQAPLPAETCWLGSGFLSPTLPWLHADHGPCTQCQEGGLEKQTLERKSKSTSKELVVCADVFFPADSLERTKRPRWRPVCS